MTLRVATWNVWFDDHRRDERCGVLLRDLLGCNADVIGLQEATTAMMSLLPLPGYVATETRGAVLLSRRPLGDVRVTRLPGVMGRHLVSAVVDGLRIATVHLESTSGAASVRREQLRTIFAELGEPSVLMGDFNFCSTSAENESLDPRWLDVWPALRPTEPGWTEDADVNLMRQDVKRRGKQVRFDRILLRDESGRWSPRSIDLLGTRPSAHDPRLFASDHFGLVAALG